MPRPRRDARIADDIARACRRGQDVAGVQHEAVAALRRAMTIDAAFLATADPDTLLFTGARAEEPLQQAQTWFLDNEFGTADVNKFAALATGPSHVATLDGATRRDRASSPRYRDVMAPLGLGDELRAALVVDGRCWGYLCLHREDHELGFAPAEAALLARVAPEIARGLRRATLLHGSPVPGAVPRPGVVVLDDDLGVVAVTPEADECMEQIVDQGAPLAVPAPVRAAAAALLAGERHPGTAPPPVGRVRAAGGRWLHVHASRLHGTPGSGHIAVVLEDAGQQTTAPLLLAAHGLTPREAEVATLVLRGSSTAAIVDTLHISRHTVQDHLKAVFDKVGVRSRRDLVGRLLGTGGA